MIPSRRFPFALAGLAAISLLLGLIAAPAWQGLPAAGGALLLALAALERLGPGWHWPGLWQHPPRIAVTTRVRRRPATLHLLFDSRAPAGAIAWQRDRDQALGFLKTLAASGNEVRLYGLAPALRLLAATAPERPLVLPELRPGPLGDLRSALAQLCRQACPGSVILVVAPVEEELIEGLARLDRARRGLEFWLVDTAQRSGGVPTKIRGWRGALAQAEAWQAQLRHERLAVRLRGLDIRWLPSGGTARLQTRLLQCWEADGAAQIAD